MSAVKPRTVLQYINSESNEKIIKGLKELKKKLLSDKQNFQVYKNLQFMVIAVKLLKNPNQEVLNWTLSVLGLFLTQKEFFEEFHCLGIHQLVHLFQVSRSSRIQLRICRIFGQQSLYGPSCLLLHTLQVVPLIIAFLKDADEDEPKESAIKALRCLVNSSEQRDIFVKERGLYYVCISGLSLTCKKLRFTAIKAILHFIKKQPSPAIDQLLSGSDNFLLLAKVFELHENELKKPLLEIFLTVFSNYSKYSNIKQYVFSAKILDYLCMAKLPLMIVSELQTECDDPNLKIDKSKLIVALCKLCGLNENWKKFSFSVLPSYHERTWMQLTDCGGVALLVSLLSSHRNDLFLMQYLLRALLAVENLHSNRVQVLFQYVEAKLLPLLAKIFDEGLKIGCKDVKFTQNETCCHYSHPKKEQQTSSISGTPQNGVSNLLDNTLTCNSSESSLSFDSTNGFSILNVDNNVRKELQKEMRLDGTLERSLSLPAKTSYKEMNKIKFRTGKRLKGEGSVLGKNEVNSHQDMGIKRKKMQSSHSEKLKNKKVTSQSEHSPTFSNGKTSEGRILDKVTQSWMNILEYVVRLLYQVILVKEDLTTLCREFLPKIYHYMSEACVVHFSGVKFLSVISKNPSSVQYVLDILFIPQLAVDLQTLTLSRSCSQCTLINKGIKEYLTQIGQFFSHQHQYGRCEVANRLHPSKTDGVRNSCLVALTHVVKCPKLLHSFLLEQKGLDSLLNLLSSPFAKDTKMYLYGVASLCSLVSNLKIEFDRKHKNNCLFCVCNLVGIKACANEDTPRRKDQLLLLTSSNYKTQNKTSIECKLIKEKNKNCCFKLDQNVVFANREFLALKNEVMKGMLQGSFVESNKHCVEINSLDSLSMEMVLHFIYGCSCDIFFHEDPRIYTELLFVSQMYFIPELQILAMHHLALLLDAHEVCAFILEHIEFLGSELLQHIFCSLLGNSANFHQKAKWIFDCVNCSQRSKLIENIGVGVTHLLQSTSSLCSCDVFPISSSRH